MGLKWSEASARLCSSTKNFHKNVRVYICDIDVDIVPLNILDEWWKRKKIARQTLTRWFQCHRNFFADNNLEVSGYTL